MVLEWLGVALVLAGLFVLFLEFAHPGALLFIPGSILIVSGVLITVVNEDFLATLPGVATIVAVALAAAFLEIPFYKYIAPTHRPMTTTSGGLEGETGILIAPVVPNTMSGKVRVKSEVWSARSDRDIPTGTRVRIISGEGVTVTVVPIEEPR
jgi:membrane-bound ClpP family serine protease